MNFFLDIARAARWQTGRIIGRPGLLFLFVVWPFAFALLLGGTYSKRIVTDIPLAVVDLDHSKMSRLLTRWLDATRTFEVRGGYDSPQQLAEALRSGKIAAGIVIGRDFQRTVKRGKKAQITAYVDGGSLVVANLAMASLQETVRTLSVGVTLKYLEKTGVKRDRALVMAAPVQPTIFRLFNPGMNYMSYLAPGLWVAAIHLLLLIFGALLVAPERATAAYAELYASSRMPSVTIPLGAAVPYAALGAIFFVVCYGVFFPVFGVERRGEFLSLMSLSALFVMAVLALGATFSAWSASAKDAMKLVLLIGSPAFALSGYSWPHAVMPTWATTLANAIPLTPYLRGFRRLAQLGQPFEGAWREAVALVLMILVFSGLTVLGMRRKGEVATA